MELWEIPSWLPESLEQRHLGGEQGESEWSFRRYRIQHHFHLQCFRPEQTRELQLSMENAARLQLVRHSERQRTRRRKHFDADTHALTESNGNTNTNSDTVSHSQRNTAPGQLNRLRGTSSCSKRRIAREWHGYPQAGR